MLPSPPTSCLLFSTLYPNNNDNDQKTARECIHNKRLDKTKNTMYAYQAEIMANLHIACEMCLAFGK